MRRAARPGPYTFDVFCALVGDDQKGILTSKALPGFWLRVEWLWQEPLPKTITVLREILGPLD
jgi:hypothetical protein